ncbi:putative RSC complex subunit [Xylona heveae TC161]|uniref:Putative RSC complex subunit n=1 Tax=Xylona heveae (strain CBS 132557 / TC161) TaxID=1328760 RepID=A0A165GSV8_XYLHT|nr:putative RSC complex subunit [Xylona heveae TC161]KZF22555.1 putative RSC complex subunit [Xylona heveae TC161]
MSLPPNLTQQHVRDVHQKFNQMKQQGVREDDPEYIKAHNFLMAVQQTHLINKQRQAFAQQQRQQQAAQQQQQAGTPVANGVNGRSQRPGPQSQTPSAGAPANAATPIPNGQVGTPQKPNLPASTSFTPEQLSTLRNQILAFKLLSKNLAIPPHVQQQLFASQQAKRAASIGQDMTAANDALNAAAPSSAVAQATPTTDGEHAKPEEPEPRNGYQTFTSPYKHLQQSIGYADHGLRDKRLMVPSIMPVGVDVDQIREERERLVYNRIMSRKTELEQLPANLGVWDTSKSDAPNGDDSLKLKALIEYKMLCLLPKQRALRQQISRDMIMSDNLAMTANRALYRRMKRQSLREARITEKLEKQQRDARESREKKKQYDHLQAVLNHGREIQMAAQNQRQRVQKLGRIMIQHHQHIEKEEQRRVERTAKQRLQALKANDEETYLKLLGQAKDSRISHLLSQTDNFLSQLASSVKEQQRSAAARYGEGEFPAEEEEEGEEVDEGGTSQINYYQVAHRIQEEVKVQPSILVGGTLKEYQIKGLQWMISLYNNNLNGILADEMGLGKTIQTISLITYLIEMKKQNGPFLVIVPLSTLTNWNLEFEKWAPSIKRIVYKGPPNVRKQQQQQIRWGDFQVLLTTYEYIIKDRPILCKIKWIHMIVDEGHRMKNTQSKLSSTLTSYYTSRYRLILTGTPLQNNLPELWALLNFALPTIFKSVKSFDEWFNTPFANTGGQDKMELTEEEQLLVIRRLHKVLRPFLLRRLKKDVEKDLPQKQERVIKCKFSALQSKLYRQLVNHNKLVVSDGKGGKTGMRGLSNMLMQLRKLCNHPFVFDEVEEQMNPGRGSNDLLWRTAGKFELLDRILPKFKATGHRVLMFFQMTQIMNIMEDFLRLRGLKYLRLDGSTKADDRSDLLKVFNAPGSDYFCFLLSTRAGGLGLNLQTADTVIIFDSDWNPHQDLQAQDRAHRIGQKNEVRILRLISSNSVEEKILERANYKLDMDGKVIQAGKFDNKSTNEEREALLRVMLESADASDNLEQDEMDDDDLNAIMTRSDDELIVFQKLDAERARDPRYSGEKGLPRLMGESELPEIYMADDNAVVEEIEETMGRGARERTRVRYDDGLTEEQWLEAVDNDEDTIEEAIARRDAKMARRAANKEKKQRRGDQGPDESPPPPDRDSSETPQPRKRGRKPLKEKRKAEEVLEEPTPKRKRGRQSKAAMMETLTLEERAVHQKIFNNVFEHVVDLEEPITGEFNDEGDQIVRGVTEHFMKLPPKSLPGYYAIIQNPMCLDMIRKRINKEEYQSVKEFRDDLRTMCNNARTFNEDASQLFQDANTIEAVFNQKLKDELEKYPDIAAALGDADDAQSSASATAGMDGVSSTGLVSGADTPLGGAASSVGFGGARAQTSSTPTPGPGPTKLKLTMGSKSGGSGPGAHGQSQAYPNGRESTGMSDDE